jgi:succinate-semialdehyde dehydrogenase/glutarate-semialdehyde dehydrogenase
MTAIARERIPGAEGREELILVNPATLETLERVPLMTAEEVRGQVRAAERAFPGWRDLPVHERARYVLRARDYLLDHVDDVALTITREMGKPRVEALVAEILVAADLMGHYAERAEEVLADREIPIHLFKVVRQSHIRHEPIGVVSIISPWNYPFSIHVSSIVFALLAGNTVVYKGASDATLVAKKIDEMFREGGRLPQGVLNLVVAAGASLGTALYEPPIRKVVFTGSTETGSAIMAAAAKHVIPVTLELGGKDAMVVLPDADLERAAAGAVWAAFSNSGQTCASVERCYVHRSVYEQFVSLVVDKTSALRQGDPADPNIDVGPMANEAQLRLVEEHVDDALAHGARALTGGGRLEGERGLFFRPTVLVGVNHSMRCMREETFGPTLPIVPWDTEDEVVRLANDSEFGLTASIWSRDRARAERLATRLEAGTVSINDHMASFGLPEAPWQGVKKSGIGVSHSDEGLRAFTVPKHIAVDRMPFAASPWWYPYSAAKYEAFKGGIRIALGGKGARSVFDGLRGAVLAFTTNSDLNTKAWHAVRSAVSGTAGECREEAPPDGLWSTILWASTPCEADLEELRREL